MNLATVRKTAAAAAGLLANLVALGVLHGDVQNIAVGLVSLATVAGVYTVRNGPKAPDPDVLHLADRVADIRSQLDDLEQSHPGLEAIADLVKTGVVAALQHGPVNLEPLVAEIAATPAIQVSIDGKSVAAAVQPHLRDQYGRFIKAEPAAPAEPGPVAGEDYPETA